jgi:hypothetical protein
MVDGLLLAFWMAQAPAALARGGAGSATDPAGARAQDSGPRTAPGTPDVAAKAFDPRPTCPIQILRPSSGTDSDFARPAPLVDHGMLKRGSCVPVDASAAAKWNRERRR